MAEYFNNGIVALHQADARALPLPDQSAHVCICSPPYYGLRVYSGIGDQGIGLEASVDEYVANLVDVFREVWRVLRSDGTVFLNLGDSYYAGHNINQPGGGNGISKPENAPQRSSGGDPGMNPGNLLGIPWRVALALQADGWTLRSEVIWCKPNPMPESVGSTRWEQCRVKVGSTRAETQGYAAAQDGIDHPRPDHSGEAFTSGAQWSPCPGCERCRDNGGLVLRRGSWRPTSAHEHVFMLVKSMGYFGDGEAVREAASHDPRIAGIDGTANDTPWNNNPKGHMGTSPHGRNRRDVWTIATEPYGGAHFATFPQALVEPCILSSTSERGCCPACGSQWARVVELGQAVPDAPGYKPRGVNRSADGIASGVWAAGSDKPMPNHHYEQKTLGFRPTCGCLRYGLPLPPVPATVLDPFVGTGTTCLVAQKLGRRAVGVDLSEEYLQQAVARLSDVPLPLGVA